MDLALLSPTELLSLHADIGEELRQRGIVRSSNNPVGDLAEYIFCRAFGWTQAANSTRSADAACAKGIIYQIKGRRTTRHNRSRELGALRDLPNGGFDFLAGVIFAEDYSVAKAAIIPRALVLGNSAYVDHTRAWKFVLRDGVWEWPGVIDVTAELRAVRF